MERFRPFVRYARKNEQRLLPGYVRAVDHRLFYCHSGKGNCEIQGKTYDLSPGTVVYIPAGTAYKLSFRQEKPVLSGCNFDLFWDHSDCREPIPPVDEKDFSQEMILEKQIFSQEHMFSAPIYLNNVFSLEYKFLEIADEFQRHSLYWDACCSAMLHQILIRIGQLWQARKLGVDDQKGNAILGFIHANYQKSLTNGDIAQHFGYHPYYISTLVRKFTGLPLHRYLMRYRMHTAVGLLQSSTLSVGEVGVLVGMPDVKHFSKCFKQVMGVPPTSFRTGLDIG